MAKAFMTLDSGEEVQILRQRGAGPDHVLVRIRMPDGKAKWQRLKREDLKRKKILKF
jgi:hypothetical protein